MTPGILVSIDPGLRACGVAVFRDGRLIEAGLPRNPEQHARGPGAWDGMALTVCRFLRSHLIDRVVCEWPQIYAAGKSQGDPDDLLELAGCAATVIERIRSTNGISRVATYKPREWKGQVPKEIHNRRILGRLHPTEIEIVEVAPVPPHLRHNMIDGIGIGLHALDRKRQINPSAA